MSRTDRRSRRSTTARVIGSRFLVPTLILGGCAGSEPAPAPVAGPKATPPTSAEASPTDKPMSTEPVAAGETCLGVADHGIWPDLDEQVQLALPASATPARSTIRIDRDRKLAVLFVDGFPVKPYPLSGDAEIEVAGERVAVRPGDRAELARLSSIAVARPSFGDTDDDGIPDPLDILIGAKKTALNADDYTPGYFTLKYPMGDMPRDKGVCTDVVIRALRNAGIDLQVEVQRDIRRRRDAYPMVKRNGDASIDHRRVRTLLPYFVKHWERHTVALDDPDDPLRPGDVIFMDTFPNKSGPDHIGIISDTPGESGLPQIINNWTDGTVTTEMDLLSFVPITHRFRAR
jgi:uncharacterized protein YijF (DUF1287 family)